MKLRVGIVAAGVLAILLTGCTQAWLGRGGLVEQALMSDAFGNTVYLFGDIRPDEVPDLAPPEKLRPCCAFGSSLGVSLGVMPIHGFELKTMRGLGDLGPHKYDNGMLSIGGSDGSLISDENNGLLYTCHGGVIDTAHLRDYADWMMFFTGWVARHLETGGVLELENEGGARRVVLEPIDPALIRRVRVRALSLAIGEWLAFRISIWHEIATWYGWSAIQLFPERASAFSPEDLYSNLLGIKIVRSIVEVGASGTEDLYNRNMDLWIHEVLSRMGDLDPETGEQVAVALDGYWWDSSKRLPDPHLVLRRNMDIGYEIRPWQGIDGDSEKAKELLDEACPDGQAPFVLANQEKIGLQQLSSLARIEIEVDPELGHFPLPRLPSRTITQADFPGIIEQIRLENAEEFGPGTDRPR